MTPQTIDRKAKAKLPHQPIPVRPPEARICDFEPVKLSYDEHAAIVEASRCLSCSKQPCVQVCPLHNDIPTAMHLISEGKFIDAAAVYYSHSTMPEICARVCPQENFCEGACVLGKRGEPVAMGALERFVTDYALERGYVDHIPRPTRTGKQIAMVGSGPAALSAAQCLLARGHDVTLYEALPAVGGWLTYAIPTYKLPRDIVTHKIDQLKAMGARFITDTCVGEAISLAELRAQSDAVFIGVGAMIDAHVDIEGRDLPGVCTGTEFLMPVYVAEDQRPPQVATPQIGKRVAVFGGGDTAMDCVRTAVRLQRLRGWEPDVTLYYRRTDHEMPASHRERKFAIEEGVTFIYLAAPLRFDADERGRLASVTIQHMELGEPDSSGRRRPVPVAGDTYPVACDVAVLALGYWPDPLLSEHAPELETHRWGLIVVDQATGSTNLSGVFAGGDAVRGPNLVSRAVRDGMTAADAIHRYVVQHEPHRRVL